MAGAGRQGAEGPAHQPVPAGGTGAAKAPARTQLPADVAGILALQRMAGNQAVTAAIGGGRGEVAPLVVLRQDAGATTPGAVFSSAVTENRYDDAIRALDPLSDDQQAASLRTLSIDQLTRLADAARRVLRNEYGRTTTNVYRWQTEIGERTRFRRMFEDGVSGSNWNLALTGSVWGFETPGDRSARLGALSLDQLTAFSGVARAQAQAAGTAPVQEAAAAVEAARVARLESDYQAAVGGGQWVQAATLVNAFNDTDLDTHLGNLLPDQRVQMMAAARQDAAIGTGDRIISRLQALTGRGPGAIFGTVTWTLNPLDGTPTSWYELGINITFTPDPAVANASEIAFVQTLRRVDTASSASVDNIPGHPGRLTPQNRAIDRLPGRQLGWYGYDNPSTPGAPGTPGTLVHPGSSPTPLAPATFEDHPSWGRPNTTWTFETAVTAKAGAQAGLVYSVIQWGFTVDAALHVTPMAVTKQDRVSSDFTTAVGAWNQQAAGPAGSRSDPNQQPLPAFR
jgi:hypothetical protein